MTIAYAKRPAAARPVAERRKTRPAIGVRPLVFFILLGGFALRLMLFLGARPLWLDEAMLANNIRTRTILGLLKPLDNHQGAPIGFLIAEKLLWNCLHTDWSLRLVSLAAGCATIALIDVIVKPILPGAGRAFAAMLSATSLPLIYYSTEIKPYALDVAIALLIVVSTARWVKRRSTSTLLTLTLIGTVAVWFSYPAIFVLGAVGVPVLITFLHADDRKTMRVVSTVAATWLVSFAVVYALTMRHLSRDPNLSEYWEAGFMPYTHRAMSWVLRSLVSAFRTPGGFQSTKLAALSALVGAGWLWRQRRLRLCGSLILIVAIPLMAAMLHSYPFEGRLILFMVPAEILLITCGAIGFPDSYRSVGIVVSLLLATLLLRQTVQDLPALFYRGSARDLSAANHLAELGIPPYEDMTSAMSCIRGLLQPGSDLYIIDVARPAFEYYGATRAAQDIDVNPTFFSEELDLHRVISKITTHPKALILLSHLRVNQDAPSLDLRIIHAINGTGLKSREMKFAGCRVICVEPEDKVQPSSFDAVARRGAAGHQNGRRL